MATHSSVLAWRIPGMGEPGGLPSMGSHRVGHDWSDLAAANNGNGSSNLSVNWHPFLGPIQRDWSQEYWGNGNHLLPCLPTWLSLWSHLLYFTLSVMSLLYFPFFSPICSTTENLNLLSFEQGGWLGWGEKTNSQSFCTKICFGVERVMAGFFSSSKLGNKKSSFNTKY